MESKKKRVYVSNLPYQLTAEELKEVMWRCGEVENVELLTGIDGSFRGCAVVSYSTAEEAQQAIATMVGVEMKDRPMFIREDREVNTPSTMFKNENPNGGFRDHNNDFRNNHNGFGNSNAFDNSTVLFVGNLPFSVSWRELKDLARPFGNVIRANVHTKPGGRSRGHGILIFETAEEAQAAIAGLHNHEIQGRFIEVRENIPHENRENYKRERSTGESFSSEPYNSSSAIGSNGRLHQAQNQAQHMPKNDTLYISDNIRFASRFAAVSGHGTPCTIIHVANLPYSTTDRDLVELYSTVGPVNRAEIAVYCDGRPTGNGVVQFASMEHAHQSIAQLNGYKYGGLELVVTYARFPPAI